MKYRLLILITLLGLGIRLYRLDSLPGEMWGDVNEHYKMADNILKGNFFWNYSFGGDGPLFSYITAFVSIVTGLSFFSLKLSTAIIGTCLIPAVYFFTKALFFKKQKKLPYIAAYLTTVSFWPLVHSRMAKPHILVPLMVALALGLQIRKRFISSGILYGLGLYTQASFWGGFLLACFQPLTLLMTLIIGLPLFWSSFHGTNAIINNAAQENILTTVTAGRGLERLGDNLTKNMLAFWLKGDSSNRQNIPLAPHIDHISGIFFAIGIFMLLKKMLLKKDFRLLFFWIVPFFILQLPALSDLNNPGNSPNTGRTLGLVPLVMSLIAWGITEFSAIIKRKKWRYLFLIGIMMLIGVFNIKQYFYVFPKGLPNENTPFGRVIADELKLPTYDNLPIMMIDCCWADAGQPEPGSIKFQMPDNRIFEEISPVNENINARITELTKASEIGIILSPDDNSTVGKLQPEWIIVEDKLLVKNSYRIAQIIKAQRNILLE